MPPSIEAIPSCTDVSATSQAQTSRVWRFKPSRLATLYYLSLYGLALLLGWLSLGQSIYLLVYLTLMLGLAAIDIRQWRRSQSLRQLSIFNAVASASNAGFDRQAWRLQFCAGDDVADRHAASHSAHHSILSVEGAISVVRVLPHCVVMRLPASEKQRYLSVWCDQLTPELWAEFRSCCSLAQLVTKR